MYINERIKIFQHLRHLSSVDTYKKDLHEIWSHLVKAFQCSATHPQVINTSIQCLLQTYKPK